MENLTIITPVYNGEKFINRYLNSVKTLNKTEFIFIDDCSTDNSYNLLKEFQKQHNNCHVIKNKENMGVSYSRNQAIKKASKKYILFLDVDDYLLDNFTSISALIKSDYDFVCFGVISKKNNQLIRNDIVFNNETTKNNLLTNNLKLFFDVNVSTWIKNKLYKTSIIKQNNIFFDESITFAEDLKFNLAFFNNSNNYFFFDKHLVVYDRDVPLSLSRQHEKRNVSEYFKHRKYIENFLTENNIPLNNEYYQDCAGLLSYSIEKVLNSNISSKEKIKELNPIITFNLTNLLPHLNDNIEVEKKLKLCIENKTLKYLIGE